MKYIIVERPNIQIKTQNYKDKNVSFRSVYKVILC